MTKTYITVNKHTIAGNHRHGRADPPIRVARGRSGKGRYGTRVRVAGPSELVYDPEHPLKCGARLWLETDAEVEVEVEK